MKDSVVKSNILLNSRKNTLDNIGVLEQNKKFWDNTADKWVGVTALPTLGCLIPSEEDLHLFGDVSGKKVLEIGCGSGHSLKYHGDHNASELWGLDMSTQQIENTTRYLKDCGYEAHLFNSPMEENPGLPMGYFDIVYSIYAIGWTTDLQKTFNLIASYLKKGGTFIFSWDHPVMRCMEIEEDNLVVKSSYYDENLFTFEKYGFDVSLSKRKISTYINALSKAGFFIEEMIEETDKQTLESESKVEQKYHSAFNAKLFPLSFVFKARKL
ncbi:class I SAM-dependent methyltransferase [Paenibacillus sp. FSL H7-0331]|uniref:class I SAM-dependent methyltransferase n=1 Tax=Paenibacillus sp. FSL H7-0331 TaxID=1920421 RepID=UPI00096CCB62|nr:class I SAM-dependent methyltransferase [Paenibacillus sp. FSL H7-0331]OME97336.1 SAM-dependent methyltransferase [Paenibacillus sp. FSL H7-0331]